MNIRKPIQDALVAGLADPATGFSARLAALAPAYGVESQVFAIDFARRTSPNFLESMIDGMDALERSQIESFPALSVYSSMAVFTGAEKGRGFSGSVTFHIDIWLSYRFRDDGTSGMETNDTESIANAVEAAILDVFHQPAFCWPTGVTYNRAFQAGQEQIIECADGYAQRVRIQMQSEVRL